MNADNLMPKTSRYSYYVTNEFYLALKDSYTDWQLTGKIVRDPVERDEFRSLIEQEARHLDRSEFDEWLSMFDRECVYWAPATPHGGDPRTQVAINFDDRRRMEDRVYRIRTGFAWSQTPASRTSRIVSNVEVFEGSSLDIRMVRSNFLISEYWDDGVRHLAGWYGHQFKQVENRWLISAKQVNLINCDQSIRNPSAIL